MKILFDFYPRHMVFTLPQDDAPRDLAPQELAMFMLSKVHEHYPELIDALPGFLFIDDGLYCLFVEHVSFEPTVVVPPVDDTLERKVRIGDPLPAMSVTTDIGTDLSRRQK